MGSISINTGKITLSVERDGEHVGEISFNPSDAVFAQRYNDLVKELAEKQVEMSKALSKEAESVEDKDEDEGEDDPGLYIESCNFVKSQIDKVFGAGSSQTLFGDACSFSMFNDFFAGIAPIFAEARAKKIKKYTE
ncbi:MAG: hypothetical protein AAGU32_16885 [Bacillota bacterium]